VIRVKDVAYNTISDAAKEFGVSTKTVNEWIRTKKISPPPTLEWGAGILNIFPSDYMQRAKKQLAAYRHRSKSAQNGAS